MKSRGTGKGKTVSRSQGKIPILMREADFTNTDERETIKL